MSRFHHFLPALVLAGGMVSYASVGCAQVAPAKPTGLWLTTDFPVLTERIGEDTNLSLTLSNSNLPPARVAFSVNGLPEAWKWELDGGGRPISAAIVGADDSQRLTLKITTPGNIKPGTYNFTVRGTSDTNETLQLPISMTLAAAEPDKVTLTPSLPALRGTPRSNFDFDVAIKNDSQENETLNLVSDAPSGFATTFKEQYGSQELTSLPFKPGETKTVKVSVKPPQNVAAGKYPVMVEASSPKVQGKTQLVLDITGEPSISLSGPDGRLSGRAVAGREQIFNFTINNSGTAPANDVKLSASAPSGWNVQLDPKTLDAIAPGAQQAVAVHMTPSNNAIAGDYMVSIRADGNGASDNADFRVTVTTSTIWGAAGLGVIGAAVIVLAMAVTRYGRR